MIRFERRERITSVYFEGVHVVGIIRDVDGMYYMSTGSHFNALLAADQVEIRRLAAVEIAIKNVARRLRGSPPR